MARKVKEDRLSALKHLIVKSKDAGPETRRVCVALIDASEGLTRPVYFTGYSKDIASGIHDMLSENGNTRLGYLMRLIGTKFKFSSHCGYFYQEEYKMSTIPGKKYTFTIWLSSVLYDKKEAIEVTASKVKKIKLN